MQCLALTDVEQIVRLVACAANPTVSMDVAERKRLLMDGVARLVEADIWYWSLTVFNPELPGDLTVTSIIDGGWIDGQERGRFYRSLSDPKLRPTYASLFDVVRARHLTIDCDRLPEQVKPQAMDTISRATGIGHFLVSFYPLGDTANSGAGFYRRLGRGPFTDRDRAVVHVVFSQVEWLHYHGSDVPAKDTVLKLSTREREVMMFLLSGDSLKQVARHMGLSEHTIGDHVKRIYKRFGVHSRAELLTHFITGGQQPATGD